MNAEQAADRTALAVDRYLENVQVPAVVNERIAAAADNRQNRVDIHTNLLTSATGREQVELETEPIITKLRQDGFRVDRLNGLDSTNRWADQLRISWPAKPTKKK